jgi:hypothetical protein
VCVMCVCVMCVCVMCVCVMCVCVMCVCVMCVREGEKEREKKRDDLFCLYISATRLQLDLTAPKSQLVNSNNLTTHSLIAEHSEACSAILRGI